MRGSEFNHLVLSSLQLHSETAVRKRTHSITVWTDIPGEKLNKLLQSSAFSGTCYLLQSSAFPIDSASFLSYAFPIDSEAI